MLDYRIKTFLTLYDEMNYRKTAEKLNMTQPGVTQHIHFIEQYYGTKLFKYNGKKLSKTQGAEILKRYIDSVLIEEQEAKTKLSQKETPLINVGATKTIGEFVLVPTVREFLKSTGNNLNLVIDNTSVLLKKLENAEIDFAVIEGVFDKEKYGYHLFRKEEFLGICSQNHPFANKTVPLDAIFKEKLVIREEGSGTRRLFEQAVQDKGFSINSFKNYASVSNFSVITDLVENEGFITFAYRPISHISKGVTTFKVQDIHINGEFNFVYCNEKTARKKIDEFLLTE